MDTVGIRKYDGSINVLADPSHCAYLIIFTYVRRSLLVARCASQFWREAKPLLWPKTIDVHEREARETPSTSKLDLVLMTRPHHCARPHQITYFFSPFFLPNKTVGRKRERERRNRIRFTSNHTHIRFYFSVVRSSFASLFIYFFSSLSSHVQVHSSKWNTNDKNKTRENCVHFG